MYRRSCTPARRSVSTKCCTVSAGCGICVPPARRIPFADARKLTEDWINIWGRRFFRSRMGCRCLRAKGHCLAVAFSHYPEKPGPRFLPALHQEPGLADPVPAQGRTGHPRQRKALSRPHRPGHVDPGASFNAGRDQVNGQASRPGRSKGRSLPMEDISRAIRRFAMTLLADLLPLRQTYLNLGHTPPKGLVSSIDRICSRPCASLRHVDGTLALFNGTTAQPADRLLSVLRYDESTGDPPKQHAADELPAARRQQHRHNLRHRADPAR